MKKPIILNNIQIARFWAALVVVFSHVQHEAYQGLEHLVDRGARPSWFDGAVGVDVFFVISGLIMVLSSQKLQGPAGMVEFVKRRVTRIVPLYWIFTLLMVLAFTLTPGTLAHHEGGVWQLVSSLLFIPSRDSMGGIQPVLALGWTLNYEMLFYAIFALALLLPKRSSVWAVVAVIVALTLIGLAVPRDGWAPLVFWTDPIMIEFVLGILLAQAVLRGRAIGLPTALLLIVVAILLLSATSRLMLLNTPWRWLVAGGPALLIVAGAALGPQAGDQPLSRLMRFLGDSSYALYLSHPFTINLLVIMWRKLGWGTGSFIVAGTALSVMVGGMTYVLLERPILDALHRRPLALLRHPLVLRVRGGHRGLRAP